MNWDLILTLTGIMLFAYWLAYVMGGPLSTKADDIDGRAFLVAWPYELAIRRLVKAGLWKAITTEHINELNVTSDPKTRVQMKEDHVINTIMAGREFFTWERSLLCPICLHWWLTVVVGAVCISFDLLNARADFGLAAFVYLVNHFLIRKIS